MRHLRLLAALLAAPLTALLLTIAPGPALAMPGNAVLIDCNNHGQLTKSYTTAELHHALDIMPAVTKEYTDCYDAINNALINSVSVKSGNGSAGQSGSSGSFLPTWLAVVIVVLVLAAVTFGGLELRRRRAVGGDSRDDDEEPRAPPPTSA